MRDHAHLSAMMRLVRNHVAEHLLISRPRPSPAVAQKHLGSVIPAERIGKHLRAARGALGQCSADLPRRAARATELRRNLQMWSCKPDPACSAHCARAQRWPQCCARFRSGAGWLSLPGGRIKILDKNLIYAIVSQRSAAAQLCVSIVSARGHGSILHGSTHFRTVANLVKPDP